MTVTPALRHRLAQLQDECDRLRRLAEVARAELAHPDAIAKRDAAWIELRTLLAAYKVGDSGEAAIYLLGRATQLVERADEHGTVIAEYERTRDHLRKLEATVREEPA